MVHAKYVNSLIRSVKLRKTLPERFLKNDAHSTVHFFEKNLYWIVFFWKHWIFLWVYFSYLVSVFGIMDRILVLVLVAMYDELYWEDLYNGISIAANPDIITGIDPDRLITYNNIMKYSVTNFITLAKRKRLFEFLLCYFCSYFYERFKTIHLWIWKLHLLFDRSQTY